MNRIVIVQLLLSLSCMVTQAQETPVPRVPPLPRATITIAFTPDRNGAVTPSTIQVTRFDKTQLNRITRSDNSSMVSYFVDNLLVAKSPSGDWINIFNIETDLIDPVYYLTRPNVFSWVGPSTFIRAEKVGEKPANLFQRDKEGGDVKESIWCDPTTGLPMAWSDGTNVCTLTFGPPPTSAPALASEFKQELDRYVQIAAIPKQISNRP